MKYIFDEALIQDRIQQNIDTRVANIIKEEAARAMEQVKSRILILSADIIVEYASRPSDVTAGKEVSIYVNLPDAEVKKTPDQGAPANQGPQ